MTSPLETTSIQITTNILCNSSTNTARQLYKRRRSPNECHLCKTVEATDAEEAGATEVEGVMKISVKNTVNIRIINNKKKGHLSTSCPEAEKDDDDVYSSSRYRQAKSVTKLTKDFKKMKNVFTPLQQLQESDYDLPDDNDEEENPHFQIADRGFQFT